jgi:hypothetical protein
MYPINPLEDKHRRDGIPRMRDAQLANRTGTTVAASTPPPSSIDSV